MGRKGKKNAQAKIINEIQNQLLIQADLLGIKDFYSPDKLEEMSLESASKILAEFYMEKSNLEYELNMLGTNKKELMLKLQKLEMYITRAHKKMTKCKQAISKILEKMVGDQKETRKALKLYKETPKISIKIGQD